jgi:fructokinase
MYDPNFRSSHLARRDQLVSVIRENMEYATLVRASDEDLRNIFDSQDPDEAWEEVKKHCPAMVYTANAHGVHLRTADLSLHLEVERIEPLSTIGAGDTFNAGLAFGIWKGGYSREEIPHLNKSQWEALLLQAIHFSREVCLSYENYLPMEEAGKWRVQGM